MVHCIILFKSETRGDHLNGKVIGVTILISGPPKPEERSARPMMLMMVFFAWRFKISKYALSLLLFVNFKTTTNFLIPKLQSNKKEDTCSKLMFHHQVNTHLDFHKRAADCFPYHQRINTVM